MIRYRVGVINDFRGTFAFVDYRDYGGLEIWDAATIGTAHRGFQEPDDAIHVFLNLSKISMFRVSAEADAFVRKLLAAAPVDLSDFAHHFL